MLSSSFFFSGASSAFFSFFFFPGGRGASQLPGVFSARPALPRPYGPVRPPEPSSTAQLQATLKDKCTAEWVLILKSCVAGSMLAQALEASQHPQEASLRKFSRGTLSQYLRAIRLFLTFVNQCVGDLMCLTLAHLSDFIAGCHVSRTALRSSAAQS